MASSSSTTTTRQVHRNRKSVSRPNDVLFHPFGTRSVSDMHEGEENSDIASLFLLDRSLKRLSIMVLRFVEERKSVTYQEVQEHVVNHIAGEEGRTSTTTTTTAMDNAAANTMSSPTHQQHATTTTTTTSSATTPSHGQHTDDAAITSHAPDSVKSTKSPAATATIDADADVKALNRKVADILNVLTAMGVLARKKKNLVWVGIPIGSQASVEMKLNESESLRNRIEKKRAELQDLYQQHIALHMLSEFNKARPAPVEEKDRIHVPFVIINTPADAKIQCEIAEDNQQVVFHFDAPFTIRDDYDILKDMGLHTALPRIMESVVPPEFRSLLQPVVEEGAATTTGGGSGGAAAAAVPAPTATGNQNGSMSATTPDNSKKARMTE